MHTPHRPVIARLLTIAACFIITACGGNSAPPGSPIATPVELCVADLKPAIIKCTGDHYDGVQVKDFVTCIASTPDLANAVKSCRAKGSDEFRTLSDMQFGHEAATVLRVL